MLEHHERKHLDAPSVPRESVVQLLGDLASQSASLIQDEVALAKQELREKVESMQSTLVMIAVGALIALVAMASLCTALILALNEYLERWASALLVGVILSIIAGAMIALGIKRLKQLSLKPEKTLESLEENKEWLKEIT
jgi:uncharacterized membrane protein YqjE